MYVVYNFYLKNSNKIRALYFELELQVTYNDYKRNPVLCMLNYVVVQRVIQFISP